MGFTVVEGMSKNLNGVRVYQMAIDSESDRAVLKV